MNNTNLDYILTFLSFLILVFISNTKNKEVKRISNKLTKGWINTLLILLIITLSMTENIRIGLFIAFTYILCIVRFNDSPMEHFSNYGPSPLNCGTYGNSRKNTGVAFYPINPN
tara:strand:- start:389 stop:730 length:342 start_codon:yes stop_codon:yes gene_type:complete